MFNHLLKAAAAVSIMSLAACGGASVTPPKPQPAPQPQPTLEPQEFQRGPDDVTFNEATGEIRLGNAVVGKAGDQLIVANGQANVYHNTDSNYLSAIATNGDGYAVSVARRATGSSAYGAVYGNDDRADLPTTGNADFYGDYAGVTVASPGSTSQYISSTTSGDAYVYADFEDNTVQGSIYNRKVYYSNGSPFSGTGAATISFGETTVGADGRFTTSTSGGQFLQSSRTYTGNGSIQGVFAGDNGDSIVGSVVLNHNSSGLPTYQERGVFVADEN